MTWFYAWCLRDEVDDRLEKLPVIEVDSKYGKHVSPFGLGQSPHIALVDIIWLVEIC